jgi:glutathione synthase/RimK-type ligase-like ATP-grasp enzyme|tara:strand:+ start:5378 stop:6265 length:888 start_codon:yes stop_codon:yes gene_type:complete
MAVVKRLKKRTPKGIKKRRKFTSFYPQILSRHPSHSCLRKVNKGLPLFKFRSVIRFGSNTTIRDTTNKGGNRVEINTIEAIANSSNKRLMKECFLRGDVRTALWYTYSGGTLLDKINNQTIQLDELIFPIIAKKIFGSRNKGNTKLDNLDAFKNYIKSNSLTNVIFEKFYNYAREYRLHVTEDGCFYTCRKMMKRDTPDEHQWYKNDANCVWILEERPDFDKPKNWDDIINESVKALKSCGLDFGAIDLRIQSNKEGSNPSFIIVEINSAPSFGTLTQEAYKIMLPKLLLKKSRL